jgi:hypothetical protein
VVPNNDASETFANVVIKSRRGGRSELSWIIVSRPDGDGSNARGRRKEIA